MKINKKKIIILFVVIFFGLFFARHFVRAENNPIWGGPGIWQGIEQCRANGDCRLEDFLLLAINIGSIIVRFAGVVALALLILGGAGWVLAAGNTEKIEAGKKLVTGSVMGLIIIIAAGVWINGMIKLFGANINGLNGEANYQVTPACYNQEGADFANNCGPLSSASSWSLNINCGGNNYKLIEKIQSKLKDLGDYKGDITGCLDDPTWLGIKTWAYAQTPKIDYGDGFTLDMCKLLLGTAEATACQ